MYTIDTNCVRCCVETVQYAHENPPETLPDGHPHKRGNSKYILDSEKLSQERRLELDLPPNQSIKRTPGREFPYLSWDVLPPKNIFCTSPEIGHPEVAVAFAGTASPTADSSIICEVLAGAVVQYGQDRCLPSAVISSTGQGVDEKAILGALDVMEHDNTPPGGIVVVSASNVTDGLPYGRRFVENGVRRKGVIASEIRESNPTWADRQPFLERKDRIVTALADILFVIECRAPGSTGSAAVEGARKARLQGRCVYAIDWDKFEGLYSSPRTDGFEYLLDKGIAKPFPGPDFARVDGLEASSGSIAKELYKLLDGWRSHS